MTDSSRKQLLTVDQARDLVALHTREVAGERLPLAETLGRILAEDLSATGDSPPFDKSLMDGFAVSTRALPAAGQHASVTLRVAETITAGRVPTVSVDEHTAVRIMTGSPLPEGCDCVVPIELAEFREASPDTFTIPVTAIGAERCLIRRGTAARSGEVLLRRGTCLQPQHLAALAEFGIAVVTVFRRLTVGVLATGDELVPVEQTPGPGQIRNSNEAMLAALAAQWGTLPVSLGIVRDNVEELSAAIGRGLACDVFLLSGGMSAGMLDLVPGQLAAQSVRNVFHGVSLKPGKPLWFGVFDSADHRCLVFGLPGNPVSALVCAHLFVSAAVRRSNSREPARPMPAIFQDDKTVHGGRPVWHPAKLAVQEGRLTARCVPWSGSSDLRATVEANGMCLLEPAHGPYSAGDTVAVLPWDASMV